MPEPLKNLLNKTVIQGIAKHFKKNASTFNDKSFIKETCLDLDTLELKERTDRITQTMITHFPKSFTKSSQIILASLGPELNDNLSEGTINTKGIAGWAIMPIAQYIALQGQDHFDLSMDVLKELTKRSSSEFAIRPFIIQSPQKTLTVLKSWAKDDNQHVRRLASEGSRPRLPWGMSLPIYIKDPTPLLPLLEQLKDDEKEYVRRSVANSLNDIAKDHPDLVANLAEKWIHKASKDRLRLIRHACRTLIKQGHQKTLCVLGYNSPQLQKVSLNLSTPQVLFGNSLEFSMTVESNSSKEQPLMIDYIIHHQKANGKTSPKVFKWKSTSLASKKLLSLSKKHTIKKITTRVYYPGIHTLEIVINGESVAKVDFELVM